jgi:hypothetical protein
MPKSSGRPLYRLVLRPEPDVDPVLGLRALLKVLLRALGLAHEGRRAIDAEEGEPDTAFDACGSRSKRSMASKPIPQRS